jgi:hypothetical protein
VLAKARGRVKKSAT